MRICGLKLTHDAAVCVIEDGKLLFSVELEKVGNATRYTEMKSMSAIDMVLEKFGFEFMDIDIFVIDGWRGSSVSVDGKIFPVSGYTEFDGLKLPLLASRPADNHNYYSSYSHIASHIFGAYATSPFAEGLEPCYVLTWDGGTQPRIHYIDPLSEVQVHYIASDFPIYGTFYMDMGLFFGPYNEHLVEILAYDGGDGGDDWRGLVRRYGSYGIPGKLMSYIAMGTPHSTLVDWLVMECASVFNRYAFDQETHQPNAAEKFQFNLLKSIYHHAHGKISDADILASIHLWLETELVRMACRAIPSGSNLCFVGGSALNIKWNSALRESGYFKSVWVPPFPNDCGSAIGAAVCEMIATTGNWKLDWDVYLGPRIKKGDISKYGWMESPCDVSYLARLIHENPQEPFVVLHGRAELGPRALGHRSIFCSAEHASNKDMLNSIKNRELFRPVAPICLESHAPLIFSPGTPDPYMLFDHIVKEFWLSKVPAIVHIDNTARLQTVGPDDSPFVFDLLSTYFGLSGIPLLCNTSANFNGKGFFPDVASAMEWGKTKFIWSEGVLYERS